MTTDPAPDRWTDLAAWLNREIRKILRREARP